MSARNRGVDRNRIRAAVLLSAGIAAGLAVSPAMAADWHDRGYHSAPGWHRGDGWHGGYGGRPGYGWYRGPSGAWVWGLLGLGALGALAAPYVYAPPPVYYPPPAYMPPDGYYVGEDGNMHLIPGPGQ